MKKRTYSVGLLCSLVIAASAFAQSDRAAVDRKADEDKMLRMKEALQKQDAQISFFGKVVDQNNAPVAGASVRLHIIHFSPDMEKLFGASKSLECTSDGRGLFSVEKETGRSLYVDSIAKDGYDGAALLNTQRSFQYSARGDQKPFIADRKSPTIFQLRKQGGASFCLEVKYWDCQVSMKDSGRPKGSDFIRQESLRDLAQPVLNGEALVCDFLVKASFNTNDATWTAVLSPGNTNGGIILSEQLLYEAPDAGYQPEYVFTPQDRKPVAAKYVYIKSRDPAIYTRLEIEQINANKQFFRLSGKTVTNPYGDRNLEQATGLPYEVTKQLTDEAKASFRQNKRPSKPDLPKLVKEAKEKAEKDKGKP
jgi:hypothetical protein